MSRFIFTFYSMHTQNQIIAVSSWNIPADAVSSFHAALITWSHGLCWLHSILCCIVLLREGERAEVSSYYWWHHCDTIWCHQAAGQGICGTFPSDPLWHNKPSFPSLGPLLWPYMLPHPLMLWLAFCLLICQWGQSRIHQWGGRKQFKPANNHVGQVQVV